jgi:hypothetical protein
MLLALLALTAVVRLPGRHGVRWFSAAAPAPEDSLSPDEKSTAEDEPDVAYRAISDRDVYPKAPLPAVGAAGYRFTDPTFGSRMIRVTDANTRPDRRARVWGTPSSAETSAWNTDSTRFFVVGGGGEQVPYDFDPATLTASRIGNTRNESGGLVLLLAGEPSFSFVDPDLIYGGHGTQLVTYRFTTATQTALHDVGTCLPGVTVHALNMAVTADDERLLTYIGGSSQDLDSYVYVFDRGRGCRWLNTQTGQVGGQWGPNGPSLGDKGYFIHNARVSKNGKWARITAADNAHAGIYFWDIDSLTIIPCDTARPPYCGGHLVTGFDHVINQRQLGDGMDFAIRTIDHVSRARSLITPLLSPPQYADDTQPSWNNVRRSEQQPVCMAAYRQDDVIQRAWDGEIICIDTRRPPASQPSTVWRFARHRSRFVSFGDTPRANVSQDGRFLLFTSNWEETLGRQSAADGGGIRQDTFLVELASPPPPAAVPQRIGRK